MAAWAQLPPEMIDQIAKCLETSIDLLRFRSVCSTWRSSVELEPGRLSGRYMIPPNDGISDAASGFHLSKRTIYLLRPAPRDSNYRAWLIKIEEDPPNRKNLVNPLSRHRFNPLPGNFPRILDLSHISVRELGQEVVLAVGDGNLYMEKVVLKRVTVSRSVFYCVLLTIHISGKLAIFSLGSKKWTTITDMPSPYDDVALFKEKFLAVDNTGRTVNVDVSGSLPELGLVANPVFGGDKKFLVESEGELLLVDMYLSIEATEDGAMGIGGEFLEDLAVYMSERTVKFKVYKLDWEMQRWVRMESLGDRVIFLGDHSTFSSSASDLSLSKGNSIFFVDNFNVSTEYFGVHDCAAMGGCGDIGVFELDSGFIGPLENYPQYAKLLWPPPHWICSTLE